MVLSDLFTITPFFYQADAQRATLDDFQLHNIEVEKCMTTDFSFNIIPRLNRTNTYGSTGIDKVTDAKSHITRDVANNLIYSKEHILRETVLAHLAIELHLKFQILHIATKLRKRHKLIRQGRRVVEALT